MHGFQCWFPMSTGAHLVWLVAALACSASWLGPTQAQAQDEASADALMQRVRTAYRQVDHYEATARYSIVHAHGRRTHRQWAEVHVAVDRPQRRLRIEHPDFTLVVDDAEARVRFPGRGTDYLVRSSLAGALSYDALLDAWPMLDGAFLPDVALLLAADPWTVLGDPTFSAPTATTVDGQPALVFGDAEGERRLMIDSESLRLTHAEKQLSDHAGQDGELPDNHAHFERYEIISAQYGEPPADELFQLDATGAQETTLSELIGEGPAHPLEGQPVPELTFHDMDGNVIDLSEEPAEVIVLDFWASWCMPCHQWMPELDRIQRWVEQNDKSVAIYGVSIEHDLAKSRQFWRQRDYSFHYGEARDPAATERAYGKPRPGGYGKGIGLPTTFIIHKGRIVKVQEGMRPGDRRRFQKLIDELLADDAS